MVVVLCRRLNGTSVSNLYRWVIKSVVASDFKRKHNPRKDQISKTTTLLTQLGQDKLLGRPQHFILSCFFLLSRKSEDELELEKKTHIPLKFLVNNTSLGKYQKNKARERKSDHK